MLTRLLSTGVVLALLIGGGFVAAEATGIIFGTGPADPGHRVEAIVAHIEATVDPRDLPSEGEAQGLWPPSAEPASAEPKSGAEAETGEQPKAEATAASPPPAGEPGDEAVPAALIVGGTWAVHGAATEPDDASGGLKAPPPQAVAATEADRPIVKVAPLPGPVPGVKIGKTCAGSACDAAVSPPRQRARPRRVSDIVICPLWGLRRSSEPGLAAHCPFAVLP